MLNQYIRKCKAAAEYENGFNDLCPDMDGWWDLIKKIPGNENCTDYKLLSKIRIGASQACCDSYLQTQSILEFFIIYYMYTKYHKEWDNGKGKWL